MIVIAALLICAGFAEAEDLQVERTPDFAVDGRGSSQHWNSAEWVDITKRNDVGKAYQTRCKLLYSQSGVYFLFDCEDAVLTSTMREDFAELFREDVVEVFIWPDERHPTYFEYELSPHNYELPLLVPNFDGKYHGWRPWRYVGERKVQHQTAHRTKKTADGEILEGWTAEFFIPYALLRPLGNVPPAPGSHWRMNFYRIDHDTGKKSFWSWREYDKNLHDYHKFGRVTFAAGGS